jgi:hypothetical protein
MEALQVEFIHSFPSLLEGKLRKSDVRFIEVINASVSGWGQDDALAYLERYGRNLRPDLVLIAFTVRNDVLDNLRQKFYRMADNGLIARPVEQISTAAYAFWQLKAWAAAHFHVYQLARTLWHAGEIQSDTHKLDSHLIDLVHKNPSQRFVLGLQLTQGFFRKIKEVGEVVGAKTAVFLIPMSIQIDDVKWGDFLSRNPILVSSISRDLPQARLTKLGVAEGINVIDLLPNFRTWEQGQRRRLYLDLDGHWTKNGHEIAAEVVSHRLRDEYFVGAAIHSQSKTRPNVLHSRTYN